MKKIKTTQHTPGPWEVAIEIFDNDGMPETAIQAINSGATVAVALDFGPNNPNMRTANARLIAAAPDLLDALKDAYALTIGHAATYQFQHELDELHPTHREILDKTRAAIAKATEAK
jgi:hypothetical protein